MSFQFQINSTLEEVERLKHEVKACGENIECLNKMNAKIQEDIEILPSRLSDSTEHILEKILRLKSKTETCCSHARDDFQTYGVGLYNEIIRCIQTNF